MRFTRLERFTAGALVYLALGSLWIYGVLDRGLLEDRGALGWLVVALVAVGHVAFGYVMREWAALLLPIALVLLAIPAGYPESRYSEPAPLWYGQAFHALFEVVLIAFGLGLRSSAAAPVRSERLLAVPVDEPLTAAAVGWCRVRGRRRGLPPSRRPRACR